MSLSLIDWVSGPGIQQVKGGPGLQGRQRAMAFPAYINGTLSLKSFKPVTSPTSSGTLYMVRTASPIVNQTLKILYISGYFP